MITFDKVNLASYANSIIVTDKNVARIYNLQGKNVYVLPAGERAKSFANAQKLCEFFLAHNLQKNDTVVAVGGGTVGDVTGFACSIFKRGTKLLHIPTTLIAQTDSSIGGKTAINLCGVKNAVGTYYVGDTVIDVGFLKTLPSRELLSGYGEVLKYRMLSQQIDDIFANCNGNFCDEKLVTACALFKQRVTESDPTDNGDRKMLNAGHTLGHALELSQKLSHGEAVACGLYYELVLAQKLGIASKSFAEKWQDELQRSFCIEPLTENVLNLVVNDKKNVDGKIAFAFVGDNGVCYKQLQLTDLQKLLFEQEKQ